MWDSIGSIPVASADAFIPGGVGSIGAVLRIDKQKLVAVHARPYDPAVGNEIDLYFSTKPYMSFPGDTPASTRFEAILEKAYEFAADLFRGDEIGSGSVPSVGDGVINNSDSQYDWLARLHWEGRQWDVYVGEDQTKQFASFIRVWPGKSGSPKLERDRLTVPLEDIGKRMSEPLQDEKYEPGYEPALLFDGVDDQISWGDVLDTGSSSFVFAAAFRCDTEQNAAIVGKWIGAGSPGWVLDVNGSTLRVDVSDGVNAYASTFIPPSTYADGQRHVLIGALSRSGSPTLKQIYDGVEVDSEVVGTLNTLDNAFALYVARNNAGGQRFAGEIERLALRFGAGQASIDIIQAAMDERYAGDVDASDINWYVPLTEDVGTSAGDLGTSGLDGTIAGGAKWSGTRKGHKGIEGLALPLSFGEVQQYAPATLDQVKNVVHLHIRDIDDVLTVEDGGVFLQEDGVFAGDFWTDDTGPAASEYVWTNDPEVGAVLRLGSPPAGQLTVTFRGDAVPSYTDRPEEILKRLAVMKLAAQDPQDFDADPFNNFDGTRGVQFAHGPDAGWTRREAFDALMSSAHGWWAIARTGIWTVGQLKVAPMSSDVITADDIVAGSMKRIAAIAPHWRDRVGYQRIWTVQGGGEIFSSVPLERRNFLTQEYRYVEGSESASGVESIRVQYLGAVESTLDSLIVRRIHALMELAERRAFFTRNLEVWQWRMGTGILAYWLGKGATLDYSRYGLDGKVIYVLAVKETITGGVEITALVEREGAPA